MATQTLSRKTANALTQAGFKIAGTAASITTEQGTPVRIARVERGWVVSFANARFSEKSVEAAIGRALLNVAAEKARNAEHKARLTEQEAQAKAERHRAKTLEILRNAPKQADERHACGYFPGTIGCKASCN